MAQVTWHSDHAFFRVESHKELHATGWTTESFSTEESARAHAQHVYDSGYKFVWIREWTDKGWKYIFQTKEAGDHKETREPIEK
jgi:hypothetical protein